MSERIGAELAARALIDKGVSHVFTLSGGHITPIYQFLEDSPVSLVDTRHEQAAVWMADAWARMTRKPAVVMVTAGPGFTNALTGIASARMSNTPLLLISGCVGLESIERLDLQDMPQAPVIAPLVKQAFVCHNPDRVYEFVDMAYRTAIGGRPGPVYLELPVDVLNAVIDKGKKVRLPNTVPTGRPVDLAAADELMELLKRVEKPVVIAGNGAWYSDAGPELKAFMEKAGLPVFTAGMARGLVPDPHPLCFEGSLGIRPGAALAAYGGTDLVLILGTRLSLFYIFGDLFQPEVKMVQVDVMAEEIGRNRKIDLPIVSDIKALLSELNRRLDKGGAGEGLKGRFAPWIAELEKAHAAGLEGSRLLWESDAVPIHPLRLAQEVNRFMDREGDVVVADGGDTTTWLGMTRTVRSPGSYLDYGLFGCLGGGLPSANAAQLLYPDRRVCLLTGDGSLGFNFMEFETAIRKNLPVVVVISNDLGWGMIRHSQEIRLGRAIEAGTYIGPVDYHKMVEAIGGRGWLVESPADIRPALEEAFASGKVCCINVMTDPTTVSPGSVALAGLGAYKA